MSLQPGSQLGPYEVQWLIGRGGMGEVYRATDTRLHRPVAIKVLPEELTASATAMDRLKREAQTASLLNHPNICTIYDVGVTDRPFIAMELLEGESLQHRLLRGPLDLQAWLDIAIATTEGLDAAHSHGVIHRDVKPANIFLTAHGPKLLDFGLAKTHLASSTGGTDETRPAEAVLTDAGAAVGTVSYMSPEQLHGKDLDARTDVFSLGLVLYEMATGRPAFGGKTSAAITGAILYETPRPPADIVPDLPPRLNDIILKALEKDREDRYQTAADLRADLRRLRRERGLQPHAESDAAVQGREVAIPRKVSDSRRGTTRSTRRHLAWIALGGAVAAALVSAWFYRQSIAGTRPAEPSLLSLANVQVARLTTTGDALSPAIAPDGKYFTYVRRQKGADSLYVQQTATATAAEIVKAEPDVTIWGATVSPDSGFVDYVRRVQGQLFELWRVPFLGGPARRLLDRVNSPIGWSPDGRRFAFIRVDVPRSATAVVIADAEGSSERVLAERLRPAQFVSLMIATRPSIAPAWSPDGRTLAMPGAGAGANPSEGDVSFIDVETGAQRTITLPSNAIRGLVWFDDGTLVLNLAERTGPLQLHQMSYPGGQLHPLTRDASDYDGISLAADRQTLIGSQRDRQTDLAILDARGRTVTSGPTFTAGAIAADANSINWVGDRVFFHNWVWTPGSPAQQLTQNAWDMSASPDGRTIVFVRDSSLWKADSDGTRPTQLATGDAFNPIVAPDGRSIVYLSSRTGQQSPWIISIDGGEPRQLVNVFAAAPGMDISADGRSIVFGGRLDQQTQVSMIVCDLPDCGRRRTIPNFTSPRMRWTPDGRTFTYIERDTRTNLWTMPVAGGPPSLLTRFEDRTIVDFDWSPDGTRLVVARQLETNDIVVLKGLRRE